MDMEDDATLDAKFEKLPHVVELRYAGVVIEVRGHGPLWNTIGLALRHEAVDNDVRCSTILVEIFMVELIRVERVKNRKNAIGWV
jgi:hypothetical protein